MSMFLTPDLRPFFGGTYFPPTSRFGRMGFGELLQRVHGVWTNEREKVLTSAATLLRHLRTQDPGGSGDGLLPDASVPDLCFRQFGGMFDPAEGGFGGAPKFPRPSVFAFLHSYAAGTGNAEALRMSTITLKAMTAGGIHDHLGGGFHRYSTDASWRIPHFEKMLYDQAQLVQAFLDAYLLTHEEEFAGVVHETIGYVLRDLTHTDGGFLSAEDADSVRPENPGEKGEGAFYVWTKGEVGTRSARTPGCSARRMVWRRTAMPSWTRTGNSPEGTCSTGPPQMRISPGHSAFRRRRLRYGFSSAGDGSWLHGTRGPAPTAMTRSLRPGTA